MVYKMNKRKIVGICAGVTIGALAIVLISTAIFYQSHWYNKSLVNGVDVSNCSMEEAAAKINDAFAGYSLEITGRENGSLLINKDDIDFKVNIDDDLQKLFDKQHEDFFLSDVFNKKEYDCSSSYNEKKLSGLIKNSELVKGSDSYKIVKPKSAKILMNKETGTMEVQEEVYGNKLNTKVFLEKIKNSLIGMETSIDLTEKGTGEECYRSPKLKKDDNALNKRLKACNKTVNHWIQFELSKGFYETISPDIIYDWIKYDKKNKVVFREERIEEWVEEFSNKYHTVGKTRTFTTHKGEEIQIAGGDYGFIVDKDKLRTKLLEVLQKTKKENQIEEYKNNPTEENKEKLTDTIETPFILKGDHLDPNDLSTDWNPKNYIEISIQEQKVYVWKKGKIAFEAKCITGKPVKDRMTKTGTYYIKEHMPAKVLVGRDYKTPVKNWTRITWSGTGFHSATWQNWGAWSPNYYKVRGSHGCINLSLKDSKTIYDMTKMFDCVFIY